MSGRVRPRVRVYHQVRTAHLERAAQLPPAAILFADKRYDFAEELAHGLELVPPRAGVPPGGSCAIRREVVEINEPLMLPAARSTAVALLGLGLSRLLGRPRTRVVSYAIENRDPTPGPAKAGVRRRLAHRLDLALARRIWRRLDRIAYGTQAAQELYAARLPAAQSPAADPGLGAARTRRRIGGQGDRPGAVPRRLQRPQGLLLADSRLAAGPRRDARRHAAADRQGPLLDLAERAGERRSARPAAGRPAAPADQDAAGPQPGAGAALPAHLHLAGTGRSADRGGPVVRLHHRHHRPRPDWPAG